MAVAGHRSAHPTRITDVIWIWTDLENGLGRAKNSLVPLFVISAAQQFFNVWEAITNKDIHVLRSQNIIPVGLSQAFHLDFKVSVPGVDIYRWWESMVGCPQRVFK